MAFGWEGELIRLVPLDLDRHLHNAVLWINDPEVTRHLGAGDFPMTKLAEREWMEAQSKSSDGGVTFAIETLDGKHIGFSGIFEVVWRFGTGKTGTMLGDKSQWGKGCGSDAAKVRARYAFDVLGLRMLYTGVFEGNTRSLGMLKRAGYRECGRWPQKHWKRGAYVEEVLLYLDREGWLAGCSEPSEG